MKRFLIPVALLTTALMLGACSPKEKKGEAADRENELIVWAWDPNFNIKALQIAEEEYQKDNPDFKLKIVENGQDDIIQKLNTGFSSGTKKGLPNIVLIEDNRSRNFVESYPDSFVPLNDTFDVSDFISYKVKATSLDGDQYGMPFDSGVGGMYLRKDFIEEAGLKVEDFYNITWNQYLELGKTVLEKTGKKMVSTDLNDLVLLRSMIHSSGAWYTEDDGVTPTLQNNDALREAFKIYKELYVSGIMNVHNGWNEGLQQFNEGKVVSVISGNWMTPSIKAETSQSGEWVVMPYPRQDDIKTAVNASNQGGASFFVLDMDGKEKALEFIKATFGSSENFYQRLVDEVGAIGSYAKSYEGEAFKKEDEFFGGQQIYSDFASWATEIPEVNFGKNTYAIEDILKVSARNYIDGKDLDDVLAEAQKTAENQLKK